jgi:hypothetical protein
MVRDRRVKLVATILPPEGWRVSDAEAVMGMDVPFGGCLAPFGGYRSWSSSSSLWANAQSVMWIGSRPNSSRTVLVVTAE